MSGAMWALAIVSLPGAVLSCCRLWQYYKTLKICREIVADINTKRPGTFHAGDGPS